METEILEVQGYKITKSAYKLAESLQKKYDFEDIKLALEAGCPIL